MKGMRDGLMVGLVTWGLVSPGLAIAGTAVVKGRVLLTGSPPLQSQIQMTADPGCLRLHPEPVYTEEVVVNENGTLRWAMVLIKEGLAGQTFSPPTEPVILNQQGCLYHPRVFGVQVGQPLEIRNSDPALHNVNAQPTLNRRFNIAQPVKGSKTVKTFEKPEAAIPFKCNVHPWMLAYAFVVEHPFFAVTGEEGTFSLEGLPQGTYVIEAWHEAYGPKTQSVTVADGETQTLDFVYP